ncbi:alanine racemase [Prosthecomicrobium hirschii]|uniref:Alanine racemase n=1 Tax=Prosthecodimorpha hirschii TaxID=665126 RepID=A0A0N8GFP0_9HYPH|nr:alanine racemase [Prosthecomicrobium hirschii]KPL54857.1 alanine racemase [Prosthecomicrobium hirschii]
MHDHVLDAGRAGARLTIDLAALEANWRDLAARAAPAECAAAVKADAYGLGLEPVVRRLHDAGCLTFFVALPEEALRLRAVAPDATVYLLNGLLPGWVDTIADAGIRPVLGSPEEWDDWAAAGARAGRPLPAALHIDTGMNRLGLTQAEAERLAADPTRRAAVALALVMSHLATADEPGHALIGRQLARFRAATALFPGVPASLANSAGIFAGADFHFGLVRPGVALYGGAVQAGRPSPMMPVVRLDAPILRVRPVPAGEPIGYGAARTLPRDSRIAILSVGYADGYHRLASSTDARPGGHVAIEGRPAPVVGRISMDLMAVDVTDHEQAHRGTRVELIGPHVPLTSIAAAMGTIDYEVLTSLGRRYRRVYLDEA